MSNSKIPFIIVGCISLIQIGYPCLVSPKIFYSPFTGEIIIHATAFLIHNKFKKNLLPLWLSLAELEICALLIRTVTYICLVA